MTDDTRITSPEQLSDYLKVTTPKIWILLLAVVLLLIGFFAWSSSAVVESYAVGTAHAHDGQITVLFDNSKRASHVKAGMELEIGDTKVDIETVGTDNDGAVIASAQANIPDGAYEVRVGYKTTQVISMLFN